MNVCFCFSSMLKLLLTAPNWLWACACLGRVFPPTHFGIWRHTNRDIIIYTRKMVPITGRASSFLVFLEFSKTKQRGGGTEQQQQTYQFTGYNILHRLQVYHLTLIFIIYNNYISTLYLYTYIHTYVHTIIIYQHYIYIHTYIHIWIVLVNFY